MDVEVNGSANCLAPGVQVGEYRLLGAIGEGGFGIVYRALDLTLDRVVAIKEYMPSTLAGRKSTNQIHVRSQHRGAFDAGLRSFINEARLLAKFSHPALVHVYRFFEENGTAYMVMRYYEGQTLRAFLASHQGSISQPWLEAMLSPILDVLEMLHAADCYHRDIAPDNIFLQDNGVPVLLDFGAARRIIGDLTQALTMVLKPGFAPIEQYVEDGSMPQGAWTDVYQIGAVVYLAITGKPPATSVARMINDPMPLLTAQNFPGYTAAFYAGVQRALAVRPQDRVQSISELKEQLGITSFASVVLESGRSSGFAPLLPQASAAGGASSSQRADAGDAPSISGSYGVERRRTVTARPEVTAPNAGTPDTQQGPASQLLSSVVKTIPRSRESGGVTPLSPLGVSSPDEPRHAPEPRPQPAVSPPAAADQPGPAPARGAPGKRVVLVSVALLVLLLSWWLLRSGAGLSPMELAELEEGRSWQAVVEQPNRQKLEAYIAAFPNGKHREQAQALVLGLSPSEQVEVQSVPVGEREATKLASEAPVSAAPSPRDGPRDEPLGDSSRAGVAAGSSAVVDPSAAVTTPSPVAGKLGASASGGVVATPAQLSASKAASPSADAAASELASGGVTKSPAKPGDAAIQGQVVLRISPWGRVSVDRAPMGASPPLMRLDL